MKNLEAIARRFGLLDPLPEPPSAMTEMVIFESYKDAQNTGFRNGALPGHPHIRCYWKGAGVGRLMGPPLRRVTIPYSMLRHVTEEGALVPLLRARQRVFGDQAVWIEL